MLYLLKIIESIARQWHRLNICLWHINLFVRTTIHPFSMWLRLLWMSDKRIAERHPMSFPVKYQFQTNWPMRMANFINDFQQIQQLFHWGCLPVICLRFMGSQLNPKLECILLNDPHMELCEEIGNCLFYNNFLLIGRIQFERYYQSNLLLCDIEESVCCLS